MSTSHLRLVPSLQWRLETMDTRPNHVVACRVKPSLSIAWFALVTFQQSSNRIVSLFVGVLVRRCQFEAAGDSAPRSARLRLHAARHPRLHGRLGLLHGAPSGDGRRRGQSGLRGRPPTRRPHHPHQRRGHPGTLPHSGPHSRLTTPILFYSVCT